MRKVIVTIGREFGSGGRAVGKKLAEDLGIPYYDKEILQRAAKDSGICESLFENHDEKPTTSFLYSLVKLICFNNSSNLSCIISPSLYFIKKLFYFKAK